MNQIAINQLNNLYEILGGQEEANKIIDTVYMLEDKMENQQDDVAKEFYYNIINAIGELQAAVHVAKEFYN